MSCRVKVIFEGSWDHSMHREPGNVCAKRASCVSLTVRRGGSLLVNDSESQGTVFGTAVVVCCCCCCSVSQLNTLESPVCVPSPVHVQVQVQVLLGWEDLRVHDHFQLPPPCTAVAFRLQRIFFISLFGERGLLCQELTMAEDNPYATRHDFLL